MCTHTDNLWHRYRVEHDMTARAELLEQHLGLVHHLARGIASRVGPAVEVDELVSAGALGLVQALGSFDLSRGLAFSTHASRRVRGAMLDELRSRDWRPRSVRARSRQMSAAVARLEAKHGRAAKPGEVADAMGIDLQTYWRWSSAARVNTPVSLEDEGLEHQGPIADTLSDPEAELPDAAVTEQELTGQVRESLESLPERERTVLALYYYEELNQQQIAEVLHVTESRVSQIRSQAIRHLRQRMVPPVDSPRTFAAPSRPRLPADERMPAVLRTA